MRCATTQLTRHRLTAREFAHYSGAMEAELTLLEDRIIALARLAQQLRMENQHLADQVAALEVDKQRLSDKIEAASQRLEAVLDQLPEGAL